MKKLTDIFSENEELQIDNYKHSLVTICYAKYCLYTYGLLSLNLL